MNCSTPESSGPHKELQLQEQEPAAARSDLSSFLLSLIRWLLDGFVWIALQDVGFDFLAGSGVAMFEVDKLLGNSEEESNGAAVATDNLLKADLLKADLNKALALVAERPAEAGKSRGLSENFFWKEEGYLNVRDWIYLATLEKPRRQRF
jgi:hypothetical protein